MCHGVTVIFHGLFICFNLHLLCILISNIAVWIDHGWSNENWRQRLTYIKVVYPFHDGHPYLYEMKVWNDTSIAQERRCEMIPPLHKKQVRIATPLKKEKQILAKLLSPASTSPMPTSTIVLDSIVKIQTIIECMYLQICCSLTIRCSSSDVYLFLLFPPYQV